MLAVLAQMMMVLELLWMTEGFVGSAGSLQEEREGDGKACAGGGVREMVMGSREKKGCRFRAAEGETNEKMRVGMWEKDGLGSCKKKI